MKPRAAAVLGAIVLAILAWLLLRDRPAPPVAPAAPSPVAPRAAPSRDASTRPSPPPTAAPAAEAAPSEPVVPDARVPLRGLAVVHASKDPDAPAPGARLVLVEGDLAIDAATRRYRGEREVVAGADGRFESRIQPGAEVHVLPSPADERWGFPRGMGRQVLPPGTDPSSGAFRVVVVEKGRVSGVVLDPDGNPLPGAEVVRAHGPPRWSVPVAPGAGETATTDAEGRFTLRGIAPGAEIAVLAKKRPFRKAISEPFTLESGGAREDVVVRLGRGPSLAGLVKDETGNPVAGAWLRLSRGGPVPSGPEYPALNPDAESPDAGGRFRFDGLEEGNWTVHAEAPGFITPDSVRVSVGTAGAEAPPIVLRRGAVFRVRVVDEAGAPVEGAVVSLHAEAGGGGGDRRTDAEGRLEFLAAPGAAKLFAGKRGFASWQPRSVAVPQEAEFVVVLAAGFTVEGVVLDVDGKPVAKAQVFVNGIPFGGRADAIVSADAEGRFRVPGLGPEPCVLRVHAEGHVFPDFRDVTPPAHGLSLRAVRGVRLAGTVLDAAGSPVEGARVTVTRADRDEPEGPYDLAPRTVVTGADGAFRFEHLLGSKFQLRAACGDGRSGLLRDAAADSADLRITVTAPR